MFISKKTIIKIILWFFESSYNYLKPLKLFTKTEENNIENAIYNIKLNNN